jgi:hypothetical protein
MSDYKIIFTNNALTKMKGWGLSEAEVLDTFNQGQTEWDASYQQWKAIKKYPGREVGVSYLQKSDTGQWVITSVWKRNNRR